MKPRSAALRTIRVADRNIPRMSSQVLAQKERKLFAELLQAYEQKLLPKGRKIADQILKKYPQHGGASHPSPALVLV